MMSNSDNAPSLHYHEDSPASSPTKGNYNVPAQLKHRRLVAQTATHSQGPIRDSSPSMGRRGSSFTTNSLRTNSTSLDARPYSMRSSTDDLLSPKATSDHVELHLEPSLWYSVPLLFALVPAIGGVAFKSGNVFLTDLSLLILAAIYLNWCLVTPWTWYQSARSVTLLRSPTQEFAVEDPIEEEITIDGVVSEPEKKEELNARNHGKNLVPTDAALSELHIHELAALLLCFIGPPLGSYVLHILRGSLSQIGDELVSNLHLTLFVLGAEIRPIRHAMKLIQARTLHLQRVVHADPYTFEPEDSATTADLTRRLGELETSMADSASKATSTPAPFSSSSENPETLKKANSQLQTQIDALNRAVRRYEKRATAQTMQTEARLQDLETRLREALSLAAAAATYSQKPGIFSMMLGWASQMLLLPLNVLSDMCMWPFLVLGDATSWIMVKTGLVEEVQYDGSIYANGNGKEYAYGNGGGNGKPGGIARPHGKAGLMGREGYFSPKKI